MEKSTKHLIKQWGKWEAVYLEQLRELEDKFDVNIHVYELNSVRDKNVATLAARPTGDKGSDLYLNLYEGHSSYIKNINQYISDWKCYRDNSQNMLKIFNGVLGMGN